MNGPSVPAAGLSKPIAQAMAQVWAAWCDDTRAQRVLQGLACAATLLLALGLIWVALLSDLQRDVRGLRERLAASSVSGVPRAEAASALMRLKADVQAQEARWLRDAPVSHWIERVQQGVQREAGLHLEQLRVVHETSADGGRAESRHPAHAASLRLHGSFDALLRWIGTYREDAALVALQPLHLKAAPDGSVRVEAQALAFVGVPQRRAAPAVDEAPAATPGPVPANAFVGATLTTARNPFDTTPLATALGLHRATVVAPAGGPDMARLREPLEAYELRELRVTGILQNEHRRVAIVEAGGMHHTVWVGHHLGRHHGRLERITDSALELTEWQQQEGRWRRVSVRLRIDGAAADPSFKSDKSNAGGNGDG